MPKVVASPAKERVAEPARARPFGFPLPPPGGLRLRFGEVAARLSDAFEEDLAGGAGPPLLAAVFAAGIALYFSLPREPSLLALGAASVGCALVATVRRRRGARALGTTIAAALLFGAAVAAFATWRVAAPRLDRERTVAVEGRVVDLDATAKGGTRLEVEVARMESRGLPDDAIPRRITATLAAGRPAPAVGDGVAFKARLKPPEGAVLPGGYDFARAAWFDGRGAGGYVLGKTHPIALEAPGLLARAGGAVGTLRHAIAERVRATLPGGAGAIGAALMVGEQRAIPESVAEPMRASGLTHIVSISGLHMSLVAGGVMVAVRLLLVALPGFTLHRSAKKGAAVAAFVAATAYLWLSGMQVAAVRSHLMVTIALLAVLVDRPAITMHTVAVAAVAILLVDPESAMEPSFRMSFLAVIALVASWDLWQIRVARRPPPRDDAGPIAHTATAAWRHAEGLAFSSLVAGLATAPVIVGVFHRGAPYSIVANMLVLPVVGMVIMPAAVVAALAMPFGLDVLPLTVMGWGIDYMVAIGRWTSGLPGGAGLVGTPHPFAMPLGILAVLWLSFWRTRIRLFGIVPAILSAVLVGLGPRPDVLVGRHGSPVAVRGDDGRLHVLADRNDRFDVGIWLAADADTRAPGDPSLAAGWRCDGLGCAFRRDGDAATRRAPLAVAVVRDPRGFVEDCGRADLVISRFAAPPGCGDLGEVVDRPRQATTGAIALELVDRVAEDPATARLPSPEGGLVSSVVADPTRDDDDPPDVDRPTVARVTARPGASPSVSSSTVVSRAAAVASVDERSEVAADDRHSAGAGLVQTSPFAGAMHRDRNADPPTQPRSRAIFEITTARGPIARPWMSSDPFAARLAIEATATTPDFEVETGTEVDAVSSPTEDAGSRDASTDRSDPAPSTAASPGVPSAPAPSKAGIGPSGVDQ